jgi:Domain of unknown function (DUF4262)
MKIKENEIKGYRKKVYDNIRDFGYHMTFVFDDTSPSFCYSTGVYETFNIPELFISSLPENLSFELISNYVELFKDVKNIPLNTRIDNLSDRFPVYLIEVPLVNLAEHALASIKFYKGNNYKYLQIIFPDTEGNFPNDLEYDYDQEIMGEFKN